MVCVPVEAALRNRRPLVRFSGLVGLPGSGIRLNAAEVSTWNALAEVSPARVMFSPELKPVPNTTSPSTGGTALPAQLKRSPQEVGLAGVPSPSQMEDGDPASADDAAAACAIAMIPMIRRRSVLLWLMIFSLEVKTL